MQKESLVGGNIALGIALKMLVVLVHLSCAQCAPHIQTLPANPNDFPFHELKKWAMPILSHQKFLQAGVASGLQREKRRMVPCCRMDGRRLEWLGVLQLYLNPPSPSRREKGPGGWSAGGLMPWLPEGFLPAHNSHTTVTTVSTSPVSAEGRNGFVLWPLTPVHDRGWPSVLSLLAQGKPQAIQTCLF